MEPVQIYSWKNKSCSHVLLNADWLDLLEHAGWQRSIFLSYMHQFRMDCAVRIRIRLLATVLARALNKDDDRRELNRAILPSWYMYRTHFGRNSPSTVVPIVRLLRDINVISISAGS